MNEKDRLLQKICRDNLSENYDRGYDDGMDAMYTRIKTFYQRKGRLPNDKDEVMSWKEGWLRDE